MTQAEMEIIRQHFRSKRIYWEFSGWACAWMRLMTANEKCIGIVECDRSLRHIKITGIVQHSGGTSARHGCKSITEAKAFVLAHWARRQIPKTRKNPPRKRQVFHEGAD